MTMVANSCWGSLKFSRKLTFWLLHRFFQRQRPQQRLIILHTIEANHCSKLTNLLDYLGKQRHLALTVTFDDGYRSTMDAVQALPSLRAVFFICPAYLDTPDSVARKHFLYRQLLDRNTVPSEPAPVSMTPLRWDDLHELQRNGHVIGAHTLTHRHLSRIDSVRELEREIIGSGDLLEERLNCPIQWFAYPFGGLASIDERACKIIARRYRYLCTGIRGNNHGRDGHPVRWRDAIDLNWPDRYIAFLLSGGLDWAYLRQRRQMMRMAG